MNFGFFSIFFRRGVEMLSYPDQRKYIWYVHLRGINIPYKLLMRKKSLIYVFKRDKYLLRIINERKRC